MTESYQVAESHLVVHLPVSLTPGRREARGNVVFDVLQSTSSSPRYSSIVQLGTLPKL